MRTLAASTASTPLVLVDQDWPGHAASPLSFASISAFGKDPLAYFELACGGLVGWARWDRRLGGVRYRQNGEVRWAADPQEGRELAERMTRARRWGYPVVPVDEPELGMLVVTRPVPLLTDKVAYAPGDPGPPVHVRQRLDGIVLVGERSQSAVAHDRLPDAGVGGEQGRRVCHLGVEVEQLAGGVCLAACWSSVRVTWGAVSSECEGIRGMVVPL